MKGQVNHTALWDTVFHNWSSEYFMHTEHSHAVHSKRAAEIWVSMVFQEKASLKIWPALDCLIMIICVS